MNPVPSPLPSSEFPLTEFHGQIPPHPQPWHCLGAVKTIHRQDQGILLECEGRDAEGSVFTDCHPTLSIQVLTSQMLRIRLSLTGDWLPRRSWAVTKPDQDWGTVSLQVR